MSLTKIYDLEKFSLLTKSLCGSIFIAILSQIAIPWSPVPFTLQTSAVFIITALFGTKIGVYSVCAYLLEGSIGLPVFAEYSCGIHKILGFTGGYLLSFIPAAYLFGTLISKNNINYYRILGAEILGIMLILAIGCLQLSIFIGLNTAWQVGVMPFAITEMIKLFLSSILIYQMKK